MSENPSALTRRQDVEAALNRIIDPCSTAIGIPTGLADMGILDQVEITGSSVRITLLPTTPGCVLLGTLERKIKEEVGALAWCDHIETGLAATDGLWDETRLAPHVQFALEEHRDRFRQRRSQLRRQRADATQSRTVKKAAT